LLQGRGGGKLTLHNFLEEFGSPSVNYLRWVLTVHPALGTGKSSTSEELGIGHHYSPPVAVFPHLWTQL